MSTPAGWYDDGSGRERWWDGSQWTDHYAARPGPPPLQDAGARGWTPPAKSRPVLGFIGFGLAVLGTLLACLPVTFAIALVVLFAAFVVSLIGVFRKNATKWPSIAGMALSPVGASVGLVVTLVIIAHGLSNSPSVETAPEPSSTSAPEGNGTPDPESIDGGNEFPVGDGYTMEVSISPLQLDPPKGFQGAEPTQTEYDLYWDNAQETGGQLAVVELTIHNNNDYEAPVTPVVVTLMKKDLTEIPHWGAIEEGYDLNLFNLEVPAGGSQTWKIAYVLPASEIDTVVVETLFQEDIGEGNRVTALQPDRGQGCAQVPGEPDDPFKIWTCLQKK